MSRDLWERLVLKASRARQGHKDLKVHKACKENRARLEKMENRS